jgi:nitrogen-specific signal transduction histidine kinase
MDVSPAPVAWPQMAAFVRQFSHDLRNDLNAISLEAALLKELVTDPEAVTSANRIQSQLREMGNRLKALSTRYVLPAPHVSVMSLAELSVHLQHAIDTMELEWKPTASSAEVRTDPALLGRAFKELVQNALEHRSTRAKPNGELTERAEGGGLLVLREPGAEIYPWPETPFLTTKAGRYGVGLPLAGAILRGLGAQVERKELNGQLETRIVLPPAKGAKA